jgi:hypothetical protein
MNNETGVTLKESCRGDHKGGVKTNKKAVGIEPVPSRKICSGEIRIFVKGVQGQSSL